jgi:hypothetical protein
LDDGHYTKNSHLKRLPWNPKAHKTDYVGLIREIRKTRPETSWLGGKCHAVWLLCDNLTVDGKAPTLEEALVEAQYHKLNAGNVRTEYSIWKRFNRF